MSGESLIGPPSDIGGKDAIALRTRFPTHSPRELSPQHQAGEVEP